MQLKTFSMLKTETGKNLTTNYRQIQKLNDRKVQIKRSPIESRASLRSSAVPNALNFFAGFLILLVYNFDKILY